MDTAIGVAGILLMGSLSLLLVVSAIRVFKEKARREDE